ncbi:MAG: radical SAM protein [Candidatus Omnitrophica bacterium]|nr:radical SAM protein [Candidatus Omnitrophota bacterium]
MAADKKQRKGDQDPEEFLLDSLYINPTRFCNLRCRHCWVSPSFKEDPAEKDDEMSMAEIIDIVREARGLGLDSIKLTGGEPLLRKGIEELLEFCAVSGVEVMIETNGTLVTKAVAGMFRKFKVSHVAVSLDSASEETHDLFRGQKGAFRRTLDGIRNLRDEYFSPQVIVSLYKENLTGFSRFIRLMQGLKVSDVKINTISSIGRGGDMRDTGLIPSVAQVLAFSKELCKISEGFQGSLFLDIPLAFKGLEEIKYRGCGVCSIKNILGILSDGSVSICGIGLVNDELIFGNVRGDPSLLNEIWRHDPVLKQIREGIPSKLEGVCGICVFRNRCLGGCRAEVYHNTGSLFAPYSFCQEAFEKGLFPSTRLIPEALRT